MVSHQWERSGYGGGAQAIEPDGHDPSIGELFKRLSTDAGDLVRQEITLAKAEAKEIATNVRRGMARMAIAAGLALAGFLAFAAFLIIALGNALGGAFWLSSLIVAVVALGIGALLAKRAGDLLSPENLAPSATVETVRENADWAGREARELRRDITSPTHATYNRG